MFDNITIQKTLVHNQQVKSATARVNLSADPDWKSAMTALWNAAYDVNATCESSNLRAEDKSVNKTPVFDAIRSILAMVGDVNGFKMYADECIAINVIAYAGKDTTDKSNELKDVEDNIRASRRYFSTLTEGNSTEEFRAQCKANIDALIAKKRELESIEGHAATVAGRTTYAAFARKVENRIARAITEQNAKTRAQLEAEAEERRKARNAAAKARKAAKKAENAAK